MRTLLADIRYSLRGMLTRPGFSAIVIATLALGIGANTAIFSVADATLRRGLPYGEPDRLLALAETRTRQDFAEMEFSYPTYLDAAARQKSLTALAGYAPRNLTFNDPDGSVLVQAGIVAGPFFDVLQVRPALGRLLEATDDRPEAPAVAVLYHGAWQRRFGGDRAIIGRTVDLAGQPTTIVGVLPRAFSFAPFAGAELVTPARPVGSLRDKRNVHWLNVVGRLAPGRDAAAARAELAVIARDLAAAYPDSNQGGGVSVVPLADKVIGKVRPILWVLLAAVGLVLLVACANVANLFLARQAERQKELAVRAALGASRARLFGLLTVDSLVHAALAGAAGIAFALWGVEALLGAIPDAILASMPYLADTRVDGVALGFGLVAGLASGLLVGVLPALRASRSDLHDQLKEDGRGTPGRGRTRLRDALVVAEVAMAFVLLTGAGLVTRSLWRVLEVDPGFDPRALNIVQLVLPRTLAGDEAQTRATHDALMRRVAALPGVEGVATVDVLPASSEGNTIRYVVAGRPTAPGDDLEANIRTVSSSYFSMMRVPLRAGRFFGPGERPNTVVVNEALARRVLGDRAVGQRIVFTYQADLPPLEIVGVVGDEHMGPLDHEPPPALYLPYDQDAGRFFAVLARGPVDGQAVARAIGEVDSSIPVFGIARMTDLIEQQPWMFVRRFPSLLVGTFAAIALALAMIGIYGVLSLTVRQRTHEIGIRRAVGAGAADIAGLLLVRSAVLALAGLAVGLAIAMVTGRLLAGLVFGVSPWDPLTLAGAAALLVVVTLAASLLPARRALSIDPLEALR